MCVLFWLFHVAVDYNLFFISLLNWFGPLANITKKKTEILYSCHFSNVSIKWKRKLATNKKLIVFIFQNFILLRWRINNTYKCVFLSPLLLFLFLQRQRLCCCVFFSKVPSSHFVLYWWHFCTHLRIIFYLSLIIFMYLMLVFRLNLFIWLNLK